MSFVLIPRSTATAEAATLDDIFATATARRGTSPSFRCLAAILRGQDEEYDSLHALAQLVASGTGGLIETASLAGSFNPVIAKQLSVGKIR
ncbi:MAG: hypothetical protein ABI395_02060 [Sphingobium sp.]